MQDLEREPVAAAVGRFARGMRSTREQVGYANAVRHPVQRQMWVLAAADSYVTAVQDLSDGLAMRVRGRRPSSRSPPPSLTP